MKQIENRGNTNYKKLEKLAGQKNQSIHQMTTNILLGEIRRFEKEHGEITGKEKHNG